MSTPREPLSPEERALAALLRMPAAGGEAGPSAAVDARVLASARAASGDAGRSGAGATSVPPAALDARRAGRTRPRARRWMQGAGVAASLVVAIGLGWRLQVEDADRRGTHAAAETAHVAVAPGPSVEAPAAGAAAAADAAGVEAAAAATSAVADDDATTEASQQAPRALERRSDDGAQDQSAAAARMRQQTQRFEPPPPPAPAPVAAPPPPPPSPLPHLRESRLPAAAPAAPASRVGAQAANAAAPSEPAPPAEEAGAGESLDRVEVTGARIAVGHIPVGEDARLPPAAWIERIRARRDAGDLNGARASLQRLRAAHARVAIPDDLAPLLADPAP